MINTKLPAHEISESLKSSDPKLQKLLTESKEILGREPSPRANKYSGLLGKYIFDETNTLENRFIALLRWDWIDGSLRETIDMLNECILKMKRRGKDYAWVMEQMVKNFTETINKEDFE